MKAQNELINNLEAIVAIAGHCELVWSEYDQAWELCWDDDGYGFVREREIDDVVEKALGVLRGDE